jgi:P pilus assembly chaperone PapD
MRLPRILASACAIAAFAAAQAFCFTLEPMSALLAPSGARSIATFRIKNDGESRVAVRLRALTRVVTPDGKEENSPADELFAIYPSRVLVEAGASASIKMQWKGPPSVEKERCFRLVAEELALDANPAQSSGIRMIFRYVASIYVGDEGFRSELVVKASGSEEGPDGPGILVELENRGSRHVVALDLGLVISDEKGDKLSLSGKELGGLSGANFLPGYPRRLFIPREGVRPGAGYDARISYEGEY